MADRFPIILNTSANQLQEIASGDTLDVSGAAIKTNLVDSLSVVGTGVSIVGVVTATSADINGDLDVDGHTNLDNVSIAGVVTATTVNATTFAGALAGNSATATKLATARTIGGVSFDGSANINLPGVNASGNQDTSGNAATATALQNARTIGGVSFNGTANINLPGVNASGNQDTSGTAAVATNVTVSANNSTNETVYPVFVDGATGSQGAETDTGLTYNPSTGNLSATTFTGNLTGNTTGTIQTAAQPNITSVGTLSSLNVSGNVSIGGTLTYEDVTNIDSIGVVTARSGLVSPNADIDDFVSVGSNIHLGNAGIITASSYRGDGSQLTGIVAGLSTVSGVVNVANDLNVDGHTNLDNVSVAGVTTFSSEINFPDDVYLKMGTGNDLKIRHHGNSSFITNATGNLEILNQSSGRVEIKADGKGLAIFTNGNIEPSSSGVIHLGTPTTKFGNVHATTLYGDGSNLTGLSVGIPGISTTGISTFRDVQVGGAITCTGTIVNKIDPTTENSVIIGFEANLNNTNTDSCVIIGNRAGYQNATGQANNTFIGRYAGYAGGGTNGHSNTMIGSGCGMFMYGSGSYNVAMGVDAGYFNNETYCVSIGANSGHSRGQYNVAIGGYANGPGNTMNSNYMTYPNSNSSTQWGENNICIGYQSNTPNENADNYIVIGNSKHTNFVVGTLGVEVTAGVTTHSGSVVVGAGVSVVGIVTAANFLKADGSAVGGVDSDAQYNTVAGNASGDSITSGTFNSTFGDNAGTNITSGGYNTVVGSYALRNVSTQSNTTAIGAGALNNSTGSNNTIIGAVAGNQIVGSDNTGVGYKAIYGAGNSSGTKNIAIGNYTLEDLESGSNNTVVGYEAGKEITSGENNVIMGYQAAYKIAGGNGLNTIIGKDAWKMNTGGGYQNVALGYNALGSGVPSISGNVALGGSAGQNVTDNYNTFLGHQAGDSLVHGGNNIIIGYNADASTTSTDNEITLGNTSINRFRIPGTGFEVQNNASSNHMILLGTTNSSTDAWSGTRQGIKLVGSQPLMYLVDDDNTTGDDAYVGHAGSRLYIAKRGGNLTFQTSASGASTANRWEIDSSGHMFPSANNTYDIGTSSNRVRNLYTNDLNLSNEGSKNDVDGTWGNYTIQEGESDLFLINKRNGKKYKFNLTEVS